MKKISMAAVLLIMMAGCREQVVWDADGRFEATDVVVSSEAAGRIVSFVAEEGMKVEAGAPLGMIDTVQLDLQRRQLQAQLQAMLSSRPDIRKQVSALQEKVAKQKTELVRFKALFKEGAATGKQVDDMESAIRVAEGQLQALLSGLNNNTATINGNAAALQLQIAQVNDRIERCRITSPLAGTVLMKYAEEGEYVVPGKPLMKVADLEKMYLRAYFTSDQLASIRLGDEVEVVADFGGDQQYSRQGIVRWISSESEFTPKTIQTKDSRAELVYAVKVAVPDDGQLKIGLSGHVRLKK